MAAAALKIPSYPGQMSWWLLLTRRQVLASGPGDLVEERCWRIGELAAATGVTVRTLHHFDQIGLLRPAVRSPAGHRLYTAGDLRRLYQVLALRELGIPLREIAISLDGDGGRLEWAVSGQLARADRHIAAQRLLRRRLVALLRAFQHATEPSMDQLLAAMEAMMQASHFTPEQLAQARRRHREPGFADRFAGWQRRCAEIVSEVEEHIRRGTDPADPAVQELARRWTVVMDEMSGGDRAGLSAIYAKIDGTGPQAATRGILNDAAWDYLKRAFAVGFGTAD
ncbi:MAG: MerR family transcriptional regulator, thiopeptide resistance regulator [Micromonosporaceae bacterium]